MARTAKSILLALLAWLVVLGAIGAVVRFLVLPAFRQRASPGAPDAGKPADTTTATIRLAADGFSGYCLLRSEDLAARLGRRGIVLKVIDDQADYMARLRALDVGEVDMAVFPINSLVQCGGRLGSFPASIVYVLDETVGADALVAWKEGVASIAALNSPEARVVLTADSPSEFLARVVVASFNLPQFPRDGWMVPAQGSGDVYRRFRSESRQRPHAYAMWEPDVSRALSDPRAQVLLDTSKLKGYVVDVLTVRRPFLLGSYAQARALVEEYARTAYAARDRMAQEVERDSRAGGTPVSPEEAVSIAKGIRWKNTLENYAHFGLTAGSGLDDLATIVRKVTDVLVRTGALPADPLAGDAGTRLWAEHLVSDLREAGFHPGREVDVLSGLAAGPADEEVRGSEAVPALSDAQWEALVTVGEIRAEPILFGRGNATLGVQGEQALTALAETLTSWPHYYLQVTGRVRPGADQEAALALARARADAVATALRAKGIAPQRLRTAAEIAPTDQPEAQAVLFVVRQAAY